MDGLRVIHTAFSENNISKLDTTNLVTNLRINLSEGVPEATMQLCQPCILPITSEEVRQESLAHHDGSWEACTLWNSLRMLWMVLEDQALQDQGILVRRREECRGTLRT